MKLQVGIFYPPVTLNTILKNEAGISGKIMTTSIDNIQARPSQAQDKIVPKAMPTPVVTHSSHRNPEEKANAMITIRGNEPS